MHTYAGIDAFTLGGSASFGVIKDPPIVGGGVWTTVQVGDDGDPRSAANLFIGLEAAANRINWVGRRTPDWLSGGDYSSAFTGYVLTSAALVLDHHGVADANSGLVAKGGSSGGHGVEGYGGGGNAAGVRGFAKGSQPGGSFFGDTTGHGVFCQSGSTPGAGAALTALAATGSTAPAGEFTGDGAGAGLTAQGGASAAGVIARGGTNMPALACLANTGGGYIHMAANVPSTSADPQQNALWATSIEKAWARLTTPGGGSSTVNVLAGMNIASGTIAAGTGGGVSGMQSHIHVQLTHGLSTGNYLPIATAFDSGGGHFPFQFQFLILDGSNFQILIYDNTGTANIDPFNTAVDIGVRVIGVQ